MDADAILPSLIGYLTTYGARLQNTNILNITSKTISSGLKYLKIKDSNFENEINNKIKLINSNIDKFYGGKEIE